MRGAMKTCGRSSYRRQQRKWNRGWAGTGGIEAKNKWEVESERKTT